MSLNSVSPVHSRRIDTEIQVSAERVNTCTRLGRNSATASSTSSGSENIQYCCEQDPQTGMYGSNLGRRSGCKKNGAYPFAKDGFCSAKGGTSTIKAGRPCVHQLNRKPP